MIVVSVTYKAGSLLEVRLADRIQGTRSLAFSHTFCIQGIGISTPGVQCGAQGEGERHRIFRGFLERQMDLVGYFHFPPLS